MTIKGVHVAHAMPGRVRLKVDKVKGNPAFAREAQEKLSRMPGVREVEVKPLIPMILLFFGVRSLWTAKKLAVPAWYDYLWFAFSSFIMLNRRTVESATAAAAPPGVQKQGKVAGSGKKQTS